MYICTGRVVGNLTALSRPETGGFMARYCNAIRDHGDWGDAEPGTPPITVFEQPQIKTLHKTQQRETSTSNHTANAR